MSDCKLCDKKNINLKYHIKKFHKISQREYKVLIGEIKTKLCLNCESDITLMRDSSKYCDNDCKTEYKIKQTHNIFLDNSDYVECKICLLRGKDLAKHIFKVHVISVYDYYKKYDCNSTALRCQSFRDDLSVRIIGENNPGYNHGGKLSSLSKKFILPIQNPLALAVG